MDKYLVFAISFLSFLYMSSFPLYADIYKYTDDKGVIHFTNVPVSSQYKLYLREKSKRSSTSCSTGKFDHLIQKASKKYDVSFPLIKALIKAESNFDPLAVSKAGAMGLMQIMPVNFSTYNISDPFNPSENIMGGTCYLKQLLNQFEGQLNLALAAYNAGPEAVNRYNKSIPPYEETQTYVKRVLKYYEVYKK